MPRLVRLSLGAQVTQEEQHDDHVLSAADFAVEIAGLQHTEYDDESGLPDLERRLRTDLCRLGFEEDTIDHIEISRDCAREVAVLQRMARLKARRQELFFRTARQQERYDLLLRAPPTGGGAGGAGAGGAYNGHGRAARRLQREIESLHSARSRVLLATNDARAELRRLACASHRTTGRAYVVFQHVATRDAFLNLFTPDRRAVGEGGLAELLPIWCIPMHASRARRQRERREMATRLPVLQAAGWRTVQVSRAPEPCDIDWENHDVPDARRRLRERINVALIALVVLIGLCLLCARPLPARTRRTS